MGFLLPAQGEWGKGENRPRGGLPDQKNCGSAPKKRGEGGAGKRHAFSLIFSKERRKRGSSPRNRINTTHA